MKEAEGVLSYKKLQQLTGEGIEYTKEFRVLLVDDSVYDSELVLRELQRQSQIKFISKIVTNKKGYEKALNEFLPDVVYCDFNIAHDFNAIGAIRMLKSDYPEVPFVLVTGSLNEEVASICVYEGIDDFVLKSNLARLQLSLFNAIKIRKIELQKKEVYEKLVKSETEIRNFARHINQVLEDERAHLAREIHDELGQQLTAIKIGLSSIKQAQDERKKISEMIGEVDNTIQSLRKIATALRPGILDTLGLIPSIHWLANEFEKKNGITCIIKSNIKERVFEKNFSTGLFRICQEALTNVSKHAKATKVIIEATESKNELFLKISDNGKGIANEKLENPFSMGLLGMRERANLMGTTLNILSEPNKGTTIEVRTKPNLK